MPAAIYIYIVMVTLVIYIGIQQERTQFDNKNHKLTEKAFEEVEE